MQRLVLELEKEDVPTEEEIRPVEESPEERKPEPQPEQPVMHEDRGPEEQVEEPMAPEFTELLHPLSVRDGDRIVLRVCFRARPQPKITWFQHGNEIQPNMDFQIYIDQEKGESLLIIVEVFPEDEGEYTCVAVNEYGESITTCRMTVICKFM